VLHPGRKFAEKLGENPISPEKYIASLTTYYKTGTIVKPEKSLTAVGIELPPDEAEPGS